MLQPYPILPPKKKNPDYSDVEEKVKKKFDCAHRYQLVYRLNRNHNGATYRRQCCKCGHLESGAVSKKTLNVIEIEEAPELDEELRARYYESRQAFRQALHQQRYIDQNKAWWTWYTGYLKSPQWRTRRALVLKRAAGTCEACGQRQPNQVHHLTYERVGREPLFDLAAVCQSCHDALHDT